MKMGLMSPMSPMGAMMSEHEHERPWARCPCHNAGETPALLSSMTSPHRSAGTVDVTGADRAIAGVVINRFTRHPAIRTVTEQQPHLVHHGLGLTVDVMQVKAAKPEGATQRRTSRRRDEL